jgi:hypothetical protein
MIQSLWKKRRRGMSGLTSNARLGFHIAPEVKASMHPQGIVLIDMRGGKVFSANRVGAMVWRGAAEGWSLERVTQSIGQKFQAPAGMVRQDIVEFLAQLAAEGLLVADAK